MNAQKMELWEEWNQITSSDAQAVTGAYSMRYDRYDGVTIPEKVRSAFHFSSGDLLNIIVDPENGILIFPVTDRPGSDRTVDHDDFIALLREWLRRTDRNADIDYKAYSRGLSRNKLALPENDVNAIGYWSGDRLPMLFHGHVGIFIPSRRRMESILKEAFHIY